MCAVILILNVVFIQRQQETGLLNKNKQHLVFSAQHFPFIVSFSTFRTKGIKGIKGRVHISNPHCQINLFTPLVN